MGGKEVVGSDIVEVSDGKLGGAKTGYSKEFDRLEEISFEHRVGKV